MSEVDHRNILAMKDYAEKNREMIRTLEEKALRAENNFLSLQELFELQRQQLAAVQQHVFAGGTSGNQR